MRLCDFARHTRHKPFEMDVDAVTKKYLATQVPCWREVYCHVSDDLNKLEFRAPGALADCAEQAACAAQLTTLLEAQPSDHPVFREGPLAFFLGAKDYSWTPQEIGDAILSLHFGDEYAGELYEDGEKEDDEEDDAENDGEYEFAPDTVKAPWPEKEYQNHPDIVRYRLEHDLPSTYPAFEIAREVMPRVVCDYASCEEIENMWDQTYFEQNFFPPGLSKREIIKTKY